jgi:hypothetical protein
MYYRVAFYQSANQAHPSPAWQWQSTALSSLNSLLQWLQFYRAFPQERLRIFSSSSREALNEQLARENQGLVSASVPATQFLHERLIHGPEGRRATPAGAGGASQEMVAMAVATHPSVTESSGEGNGLVGRGMSPLESRRLECELGPGGDHDVPYRFVLPASMPQVFAWMRLLASIQRGELPP